MTPAQLIYLLPYLGSLALSVGVLIYTYVQRRALGAWAFFWYVGGQTLWNTPIVTGKQIGRAHV